MGTASGGLKPPKVVIAHLDGRRTSGYVFDFSPMKSSCRLFPSQTAQAGQGEVVEIGQLKAIFFLKDATDAEAAATARPPLASRRRLEVFFHDKERLEGTTEGYSKERPGFFMVPEDPTGKIIRVFVVNANVKEVKWITATAAAPAPVKTETTPPRA
jgi:hypothetical protein